MKNRYGDRHNRHAFSITMRFRGSEDEILDYTYKRVIARDIPGAVRVAMYRVRSQKGSNGHIGYGKPVQMTIVDLGEV